MSPPLEPALQARVDAAVESLQSDPCLAQANDRECQWADYEIGPAQLNMAKSTGEAILVVDELAGFVPELVRYRNRIAGNYRLTGDRLETYVVAVHLPRRFGDVLASFAGPEFVPTSALARVGRAAWPAYTKLDLPGTFVGHGGLVFGHLVDLVPEQPLVLVDNHGLFDIPPEICHQGIDGARLAAATARNAAIAASLKQIMADHNVRFINASFGSTTPVLADSWRGRCEGPVPSIEQLRQLLHVYDPLYDVLFNSDGVIAAHASANLGSPADFPFDQVNAQYVNHVRVGFISSLDSGLDDVGRGTVHKSSQFPIDGDADVYVNWGCETTGAEPTCADPHYQLAGAFGLSIGTVPFMSTSFINPLALARLVNLRYANHAGEPMSNALIQTLKHELTPALCGAESVQPCVDQDPIVHQQLEVYRLQYE